MAGKVIRAAAVLALAVAACAGLSGCGLGKVTDGPVAGVIDANGTVALVDLQKGKVLRTIRLRSWAADIEADDEQGVFITAQSGGLEDETDDKIGIIDVRKTGTVHYVDLPRYNPYGVSALGGGEVIVDHGWDEKGGMFVCVVDTKTGKAVRSGHVPNLNTSLQVIDGVGWASCATSDGVRSLRQVDTRSLESTLAFSGTDFPSVRTSTSGGLAGWMISKPGEGRITLFNAKTGAVEASSAVEFEDGAGPMVFCRNRIVALDFTGEDLTRTGCRMLVFDPKTLELEREIRMAGGPSDIAVWRDRVVAVNFLDQTLQVVDPKSGRIDKTIKLPKMAEPQLELAVLD